MSMSKDPKQIFGERIRDFRKQAGMSQENLAEVCGLHRTYIGSIERGERNVSLLNIVALARALRVKPSELLEGIL
jgi:transcriptional regulator with XRE-family HTH domain